MTAGLLGVQEFILPRSRVLLPTVEALRIAGRRGEEAFVVWTGLEEDEGRRLRFVRAIRPPQIACRTHLGLRVHVDGSALDVINRGCYARGEILAGQIHTHPGEAYHSELDDHRPLVTLLGGLSVVVPHFAQQADQDHAGWAWYRLAGPAWWQPVDSAILRFEP